MIEYIQLPVVYVASPYTYKSDNEKEKKAMEKMRAMLITKIIGQLEDRHECAFIGPITQSHHTGKHRKNKDGAFEKYKNIDLSYISKCDQVWVVMMPGWKESVGVTTEIQFAHERGIPVRYINPETLRFIKRLEKVTSKLQVATDEEVQPVLQDVLVKYKPALDKLKDR